MHTDSIYLKKITEQYPYLDDIATSNVDDTQISTPVDTPDLSSFGFDIPTPVIWGVLIVIVGILVWIVLHYYVDAKGDLDESEHAMGDDTIFGHEWDQEETRLMTDGKYGEVAVLLYLRHLSELHESRKIVFHVSKTPGMFTDELSSFAAVNQQMPGLDALKRRHAALTSTYLQVRYGHRRVTAETIQQIKAL